VGIELDGAAIRPKLVPAAKIKPIIQNGIIFPYQLQK
jgi:hypothetical protein